MIELPSTTLTNRKIRKERFYEQDLLSNGQKSHFITDLKQVTVINELLAKRLHIDDGEGGKWILVIQIEMKRNPNESRVPELIAKKFLNDQQVLYSIVYNGREWFAVYYKGYFYLGPEHPISEPAVKFIGSTMAEVWENFVDQVALGDEKIKGETLDEKLQNLRLVRDLEKKIKTLDTRIKTTRQDSQRYADYKKCIEFKKKVKSLRIQD